MPDVFNGLPNEKQTQTFIELIKEEIHFNLKNAENGAISPLTHSSRLKEISELAQKAIKQCCLAAGGKCAGACTENASECERFCCEKAIDEKTARYAEEFVSKIKDLSELCLLDVEAVLNGDPSAENDEIVFNCFPGFFAILVYRVAHIFYMMKVPYLPRILTEYAHSRTGIDINAGAKIGKNFLIDHGTGVVIGETAEIGDNCRIYQGVTVGALSIKPGSGSRGEKRHPTIGNDVIIYANATILGGKTVIGDECVIGGNTFIIKSVPSKTKVLAQPTLSE